MPTTAPLAPGPFERLRRGYGTGPFSQFLLNTDLAPIPASLIDLTGGPETWLRAIRDPIKLDPETRFLHGITSLPQKAIGKIGLNRGWFSREPAEFFGPHFAEARFGDLPQDVIAAPRAPGMEKYDPHVEFSPAWAGKEALEMGLDRIQREMSGSFMDPRSVRATIKDVQHGIARPSEDIVIPPEKLMYFNPLTGQRGPFSEMFQKLLEKGETGMTDEEFKQFVTSLKKPTKLQSILHKIINPE